MITKKEQIIKRVRETQATRDNVITIASIAKEFEVSTSYIYEILKKDYLRKLESMG